MTPLRAIRLHCLRCMGWDDKGPRPMKYVRECFKLECPLHPYRMGKDPARKRIAGNPEWRKQAVEAVLF
jgi:hypothetical protein